MCAFPDVFVVAAGTRTTGPYQLAQIAFGCYFRIPNYLAVFEPLSNRFICPTDKAHTGNLTIAVKTHTF